MYFDENGLADGFSQTFPLDWLYERNALIATCVGGEPIERSFGDINQLWIEGAATRLFVRDIVSVEFRTLDNPQPPSFEAEEMLFQNRPNAGVRCEGGTPPAAWSAAGPTSWASRWSSPATPATSTVRLRRWSFP